MAMASRTATTSAAPTTWIFVTVCDEDTLVTCQDGRENDQDGLTDCSDSECGLFGVCTESDCA